MSGEILHIVKFQYSKELPEWHCVRDISSWSGRTHQFKHPVLCKRKNNHHSIYHFMEVRDNAISKDQYLKPGVACGHLNWK
jgi:hypothetical protein